MSERVKTIHIGKKDIYEWTMDEGKSILMPLLLESCKKIIDQQKEKLRAVRIEAEIRGKQQAFDFWVNLDEVDSTLNKILDWALVEEEYLMCQEITELKNKLELF